MKKVVPRIIRRTVILFMLLSVSFYLNGQKNEVTRKITSTEKNVPEFQSICVENNFNVFVVEGTSQKVIIETEEKLINNIAANVDNGCLFIFCYNKLKKEAMINVFITTMELNKITVSGKVNVSVLSKIEDLDIYMETSSSSIDLGINSSKLNLNIYGKGKVSIKGNFAEIGFSVYDEADLILDVKAEKMMCNASDMAIVKLSGLCNDFSLLLKDEASVQSTGLISKKCKIDITDSGEAYVSVLEKLDITGTLDGFIEYRGEPVLNIEASKSVDIKYNKEKMFASGQ